MSKLKVNGTEVEIIDSTARASAASKSTVSVTQKTTTGTNIADITINGTTTALYAPTSGGGGSTTWGNITGTLSNQTDLNNALAGKAASSHTHSIANVTNLQSTLDGKAASSHTHSIANVTNLQSTLDGKAASSHTHSIANVTNLQSTLDSKSGIYHTHLTIPGTTVPNILWGDCVLGGDKRWASAILRRLINGTWYFFLIVPSWSTGTGMVLQYNCSTGDLANTYSNVANLEHANSVCYNPVNDRYYVLQCSTQSTGDPNLNVSVYNSSWTYLEVFTLPGTAGTTWQQFISFDPVTNKLWAGHIPASRVYEISYNSTTSKTAITQHTVAGSPNYPYRGHNQDTAVYNNTFYSWDGLGNLFVGDITYSGTAATWTTRSTGAFNITDIEGVYYLGEAEGGEFDSVGRLFIARCNCLFQGRGFEQSARASGKYAAQAHNMFCEVPTHNSVYKDWYRYTDHQKLLFCGSDDYYVNLVDPLANMNCNAWTVKHPNICNQFRMKPTEIRTATVDLTITGWETNFSFDLLLGKTLTLGSPMVLRGGNVGIRRYYGSLDGYSLDTAAEAPGILTSVDGIAMPIVEAYGGARVTIGEWLPPVVPKNLGLSGYWGGSPEFIIDSLPASGTYFKVRDGNSTDWTNVTRKGIYIGKEPRVTW